MDIFKPIKDLKNRAFKMQFMNKQIEELTDNLDKTQKQMQFLVDDIIKIQGEEKKYVGNEYRTYEKAIKEIDSKYQGKAAWGVLQTGNIIDLRAAFIISQGIKIVARDLKKGENADAEIEWANAFLRHNDLDREIAQEFAKEAEIEGKILVELAIEKVDKTVHEHEKMISVRFVSYLDRKYVITADKKNNLRYTKAVWKKSDSGLFDAGNLSEENFVYKKFGGRISKANEAQPKIMKCLTQIDNLDRALRDLREMNRIYSSPTPHIECETYEQVKDMTTHIEKLNWKIKKFLAHTGKLAYMQIDMAGVQNLIEEIETLAKMISGTTGIPIHFLGLLDLLKNRATGENTREMLIAATSKDRETWKGAYEEIIQKGMAKFTISTQKTALNANKIGVEIPIITQEQWDHLEKFFLPAAIAGKISDPYFLAQIPGMNVQEELKRKEERDNTDIANVRKENENFKTKDLEDKLLGGENAVPE